MTALLLAPHNDDETLFASFLIQKHLPHVIICYTSYQQDTWGVEAKTREAETRIALDQLSPKSRISYEQWPYRDDVYDAATVTQSVARIAADYELCIAPAIETGGNVQHSLVGRAAELAFPPERLIRYLTYTGSPPVKSTGVEVVPEPEMIARKLHALAAYRSQHHIDSGSRVHFLEDLREYIAT